MKPVLETARLTLQPIDVFDLDLLYQTLTDPFVREYLMDNEIISYEKAKEFMKITEESFMNKGWGLWKLLLKKEKMYAGLAGLWSFFGEPQPQLLYALLPDHINKGYATEASRAVIYYAFNTLAFKYMIAACDTPNEPSKKVCARLDMEKIDEKEIHGRPTTFYRLDNRLLEN